MNHCTYIVLVNFKGHQDTIECLESLLSLTDDYFKVIVVDNSPDDSSMNFFKAWKNDAYEKRFLTQSEYESNSNPLQRLTFVRANKNDGFAAANNIAIRQIPCFDLSEYFVWLLNNDTIVDCQALDSLKDHYKSEEKLGILGSSLIYYDKPDQIQALGGRYNKWLGTTSHVNEGANADSLTEPKKIDYVVGASMFVSRSFLDNVGLMSESYFLYFEEVDWAIRTKQAGWKIAVCPQSRVYHKEGRSIGANNHSSNRKSYLSDRYALTNRLRISRKFYPVYFPVVLASMLLVILNRVKRGQYDRISLIIEICFKSLKGSYES